MRVSRFNVSCEIQLGLAAPKVSHDEGAVHAIPVQANIGLFDDLTLHLTVLPDQVSELFRILIVSNENAFSKF